MAPKLVSPMQQACFLMPALILVHARRASPSSSNILEVLQSARHRSSPSSSSVVQAVSRGATDDGCCCFGGGGGCGGAQQEWQHHPSQKAAFQPEDIPAKRLYIETRIYNCNRVVSMIMILHTAHLCQLHHDANAASGPPPRRGPLA